MKPETTTMSDDHDEDLHDEEVDAIELLTADHEDVRQLFADYEELLDEGAGSEERAAVARQICQELTVHTTLEEEIFYPAVRDVLEDPDLIDQAVAEHSQARALIERLQSLSASDERYDSTVQLLQEAIEHHVNEEEGELFPLVLETGLDLQALGERMWQRKEDVLAELEAEEGPG